MLLNEPVNLVVTSVEGLPAAGTGATIKIQSVPEITLPPSNKPPTLSDIS
jgi:hypothetical protein